MSDSPTSFGSSQAKRLGFGVFVLMAIFVLFQRDLQLLNSHSFLRQRYAAVPWWILAHGLAGAFALILAPFQFSSRLRQRHIRVHRIMGRLYVAGALIASVASVPVALTLGPPELVMAAVIQSLGWVLTIGVALYCVRTGRIQQHREWMMRSYPFAMVFVVARVILAIPAVERMGLVGLVSVVWSVIAIAAFLPSFLIALRGSLASRAVSRVPAR